jgi:UDP-4-amino-4,6-dideoxy-N-acetyl-beta-L-altrosamine transaminase
LIPYGRHWIDDEDIQAVVEVLKSNWITQGPEIECFEQALKTYCGANHAVAVCNGTAALHIACIALGLTEGDYLWTSPNSFVASANCGIYCGAKIDFVDIDPETRNISVSALRKKLIEAKFAGRLPKVVVPVDFGGLPCDFSAIRSLADEFGFLIVEDASHAIGATYNGEPVGSGQWADATVFSFHPVKIVTTGEGGAVTTNNQELAKKLRMARTHGITKDQASFALTSPGPWHYEQQFLGYNYRITDLQAKLGESQLKKADRFVSRRREIAAKYDANFQNLPIKVPSAPTGCKSAYHLYVVEMLGSEDGLRDKLFGYLRQNGIGASVHYIPIHTQPYYQNMGFKLGDFPHAEKYYSRAISLPIFPSLTDTEVDYVVQTVSSGCGDYFS